MSATRHDVRVALPPRTTRRLGLALSASAVLVSIACGISARKAYALGQGTPIEEQPTDAVLPWLVAALVLLLVALLLRMFAAICELLWLERTWANLPETLRKVGPIDKVNGAMIIGLSLVPGLAWVWKLGVVLGIADGFERIRSHTPFRARIPRRLGMSAVIAGWVPGLNVYLAPFLWEVFATHIDGAVTELYATLEAPAVKAAAPT
ncbi:MAG: hypothetical protein U0271_25975 [Polyangiaceae bacterium]